MTDPQPVTESRPVDRPQKWDWLHRDTEGQALLVGPDCPDCLRREVAYYRCAKCPETFTISGLFRWSWQGKSHYHEPDDRDAHHAMIMHLYSEHNGEGVILPLSNGLD